LIWTNQAAASLVAGIAPHLRVKSRQAAALLRFHEHVRACMRKRDAQGYLLPFTPEERSFREAYHAYVKHLNARGPQSDPPSPSEPGIDGPQPSPGERPVISLDYLAGFIDAEGSFMITKSRGASEASLYRARLTLTNTDRAILAEVQRTLGGNLVNNRRPHPGWKQGYQLVWTGRMVDRVLPAIASKVVLKRRQASLLLEFAHHLRNTQKSRRGRNARFFASHPREVNDYRERLYLQMKELNARGSSSRRELEPVADDALLCIEPAEHHPDAHSDLHAGGLDVREHRGDPEPVV